jgi:hypothetical protein
MTKKPKYSPPLEVMEKYIKKMEKKWLSQVKIMTHTVYTQYRKTPVKYIAWQDIHLSLYNDDNIGRTEQKYDLVLIKREWPKK